jgi:hypothetical protein
MALSLDKRTMAFQKTIESIKICLVGFEKQIILQRWKVTILQALR